MEKITWMNDPLVKDIDPIKLQFLQKLVFESKSMDKKQLLPFLMALGKRGRESQISFTEEEVNHIIEALKKHSSAEDVAKINSVLTAIQKKKSANK